MVNSQNYSDFASNAGDKWQMKCSSLYESMEHLCMNPLGVDIYFVPLLNAENPPKKYPAHKSILLARSPVLAAQFHYDREKEANENEEMQGDPAPKKAKNDTQEIELPDIEPEAFEQFLRFCYTDNVKFTAENVASVLYTANRYSVLTLVSLASKFICANVKTENAFELFELAEKFDYTEIKDAALGVIQSNTKEAVKTEAFLGISPETLELFVSQEFLEIEEVQLFEALIRWAENRQKILGNEGKSLRQLLGPSIFRVQFGKMDVRDFGRLVVPTGVLTDAESFYALKKLSVSSDYESFFSDPMCPFPYVAIRQRSQIITLDIPTFEQLTADPSKQFDYGDLIYVGGFLFRIMPLRRKNTQNEPCLGLFLQCIGDFPRWSCKVIGELMLVSKKALQQNMTRRISHRFHVKEDDWGYSCFITFAQALDPENGWIKNDTVSVMARIDSVCKVDDVEGGEGSEIDGEGGEGKRKQMMI